MRVRSDQFKVVNEWIGGDGSRCWVKYFPISDDRALNVESFGDDIMMGIVEDGVVYPSFVVKASELDELAKAILVHLAERRAVS